MFPWAHFLKTRCVIDNSALWLSREEPIGWIDGNACTFIEPFCNETLETGKSCFKWRQTREDDWLDSITYSFVIFSFLNHVHGFTFSIAELLNPIKQMINMKIHGTSLINPISLHSVFPATTFQGFSSSVRAISQLNLDFHSRDCSGSSLVCVYVCSIATPGTRSCVFLSCVRSSIQQNARADSGWASELCLQAPNRTKLWRVCGPEIPTSKYSHSAH